MKVRQAMLTHAEVQRLRELLERAPCEDAGDPKLMQKLNGIDGRFVGKDNKYCKSEPGRLVHDCMHCGNECRFQ